MGNMGHEINRTHVTNEYYSKWLGVSHEIMNSNGVFFIMSPERNKIQMGYSSLFKIYVFINQHQIIVSYNEEVSDVIEALKSTIQLGMSAQEIATILQKAQSNSIDHSIKFYLDQIPLHTDTSNVIQLSSHHYEQYLVFFRMQNKNTDPSSWLREYFYDLCNHGYIYGLFEGDQLVSVSDAPDMPYMQDKVQEIGINTLAEYRGKGYAKRVTLSCIHAILQKGKCPQWSCSATNISSEKLAYSVGFGKLADVLTVR